MFKKISIYKYLGIYFPTAFVMAIIALLSRGYNIFNIKEHSFIEHGIYGIFGIPLFVSVILVFIKLILLTEKKLENKIYNKISEFFAKFDLKNNNAEQNIKDKSYYTFKIIYLTLPSAFCLIIWSYSWEFFNSNNTFNHFFYDLIFITIGFIIFSLLNKEIVERK